MTETNKVQALLLGQIKNQKNETEQDQAYYYNLKKDQILGVA